MIPLTEKKLISTKEASELSGYNSDYIARLCREGKIDGTQVGRTWLISQVSLEAFVKTQTEKKRTLAQELSMQREKEYRASTTTSDSTSHSTNLQVSRNTYTLVRPTVKTFDIPAARPQLSTYQKKAVALLATLLVLLTGVTGAQADVAGALIRGPYKLALAFSNGLDTTIATAYGNAFDAGAREFAVANVSSVSSLRTASVTAPLRSQVLTPDTFAVAPLTASAFSTTTIHQVAFATTSSVIALQTNSQDAAQVVRAFVAGVQNPASILSAGEQAYADVGVAGYTAVEDGLALYMTGVQNAGAGLLAFGTGVRDVSVPLPTTLARAEIGIAAGVAHTADHVSTNILRGYSDAIYAYVDTAPRVPEVAVGAAYTTGNAIADAVAGTQNAVLTGYASHAQKTGQIAYVQVRNTAQATAIALGSLNSGLNGGLHSASHVAVAPIKEAASVRLATTSQQQADDTLLATLGAAARTANEASVALTNTAQQMRSYTFAEKVALATYTVISRAFSSAGNEFALLLGKSSATIAVQPTTNLYVLPEGTYHGAIQSPTATVAITTNNENSNGSVGGGNVTGSGITQIITAAPGASQQYVDTQIASLKDFVIKQAEILALNAARGSGGGGLSTGSNGGAFSNVTINNGTFTGGTISGSSINGSELAIVGTSTLATTTVSGDLTVTGTITGGSLAVSSLTSSGVLNAPYFVAASSTATSTFAGALAVSGTSSLNNFTFTNATGTNANLSTLTVTGATNVGTLSIGALNGFLKATAGAISTSLISLTSDISGILPVQHGGTGTSSFATNGVLYGNGTNNLLSTGQGGANTVLVANNGTPSFSSAITVGTSVTSPFMYATTGLGVGTSSPYATLSVSGDLALTGGIYDNNATRGTNGQILLTTGSGIQWTSTSTLGLAPTFTASYPIQYSGNNLSLAFGTTTNNTWSGTNTYTGNINIISTSSIQQDGVSILYSTSTGAGFTAVGAHAGDGLMTFVSPFFTSDTAVGLYALQTATSSSNNTAVGYSALINDGSGAGNTAIGTAAGNGIVNGSENTAVGHNAYQSGEGTGNTAFGSGALEGFFGSDTGSYNTAIGYQSGLWTMSGSRNILIGPSTISASQQQVSSGSNNISIGNDVALPSKTSSNQLDIGNLIYGLNLSGTGASVSTSGRIGIASTTPWAQLSINPNSSLGTAPSFAVGSSTGTKFVITNGGNVGVGTAAPSVTFDVVGSARISNTLTLSNAASCIGSQALQTDSSGNITCGNISVSGASTGGGWTTNSVGSVTLATTTDRVGIGATTTPYAKLSVISSSVASTTLALVPVSAQTANILDIYNTSGALNSVITANDFFGIGTTSPAQTLSVSGTGYFTGGIQFGDGTTQTTAASSTIYSASAPLSVSGGVLSISQASSLNNGYLSSTDWNTFNNKISSTSLSATYPLQYTSGTGVFSLAFATTTSNTWGGTQTFTNAPVFTALASGLLGISGTTHTAYSAATSTATLGLGLSGTLTTLGSTDSLTIATSSLYSGTTGQIPYFSGTNTLTATSSLFLAASGRVGIGTTSPSQALSVSGTGYFTGGIQFADGTTQTTAASSTIYSASLPLSVSGGVLSISQASSLNNGYLSSTDWNTFNNKQAAITAGNGLSFAGNTLNSVWTLSGSNLYNNQGTNVGIGTTSPVSELAVTGTVTASTGFNALSTTTGYELQGTSVVRAVFGQFGKDLILGLGGNNSMDAQETVIIGTNANVGKNITSAPGSVLIGGVYGGNNLAVGQNLTTGREVLIGSGAGGYLTTGFYNVGIGERAIMGSSTNMVTGTGNIGIGAASLVAVAGGASYNIALGSSAGSNNGTASNNIYIGVSAGATNVNGSNLTFLGANTDASVDGLTNATAIGYNTKVAQSNSLILGNGANVGIGTTSPSALLTVGTYTASQLDANEVFQFGRASISAYGTIRNNTGGIAYLGLSGGTEGFIGTQTSLPFALRTNAVDRLTIDTSGNVGIGTTSPFARLSVTGADTSSTNYALITADSNNVPLFTVANNGALGIGTPVSQTFTITPNANANGNSRTLRFINNSSAANEGFQFFNPTNGNLLMIQNNGNVGISSTSPYANLSVMVGSTYASLPLSTVFAIGSSTAGTATSTLFTVLSNGNVGIGTTSPSKTLSVSGTGYFTGGIQFADGTTQTTAASSTIYSASLPLSVSGGVLSISKANSTNDGYLSSTDWNTFNNKQAAITAGLGLNLSSGSLTIATSSLYSGITGQIPYFSGTNTLTATSSLFLAASGNVGVGTTSPTAKFAVGGNAYIGGTFTVADGSGDSISTNLGSFGGGLSVNNPNGAYGAYITDAPYVVRIADNNLFFAGIQTTDGSSTAELADTFDGAAVYASGQTYGIYAPTAANKNYFAGKIGIGTTSPSKTLSVSGTGYFTGGIQFADGTTQTTAASSTIYSASLPLSVSGGVLSISKANSTNDGYLSSTDWNTFNNKQAAITAGLGLNLSSGSLTIATSSLYSGITGQIPYFSGTNTLTATSSLFLATSGNVGIGTTSPYANLSVMAGSDFASHAASTLFAIGSSTAGRATTTLFSVLSSGSVSINAAPNPLYALQAEALGFTVGLFVANGTGQTTVQSDSGFNVIDGDGHTVFSTTGNVGTGNALLSFGTSNPSFTKASFVVDQAAQKAYFNDIKVGIGTTSPYANLSVMAGNDYAAHAAGTLFAIGSSTAGKATTTLFAVSSAGTINVNLNAGTTTILSQGGVPFITSDTAHFMTAVGYQTLVNGNAIQFIDTAFGYQALMNDTNAGGINTAVGYQALKFSTGGSSNTAIGTDALQNLTNGFDDVAIGDSVLQYSNTSNTVAIGSQAGSNVFGNTPTNQGGVYIGSSAGYNLATSSDYNTLIGYQAGRTITSGYGNLLLGANPDATTNLTTGGNNIGIGYNTNFPSATGSNQLNIGNFIFGTLPATSSAATLGLPTTGSLGIGTTSPYAKLSIQANNGDTATTLFAIGSSTASATTTLFSVSNTGAVVSAGGISATGIIFASTALQGGSTWTNFLSPQPNNWTLTLDQKTYTTNPTGIVIPETSSQSSGGFAPLRITTSYNQSGTASSSDLAILRTENSLGSGPQYLIQAGTSTNPDLFDVTNAGFLGLGTTSPGSLLSLGGIANFTAATSTFYSTGGINLADGCFAVNGTCVGGGTGTNYFTNSGANTYLSTGTNLGIGTTTPQSQLAVQANFGGIANEITLANISNSTGRGAGILFENSSPGALAQVAATRGVGAQNSNLIFSTGVAGTLVERARFADANLGIGTTSPFAKLSIQANNGDTATTLFAIGSSTASATTTLFSVANTGQINLNLDSSTSTLMKLGGSQLTFVDATNQQTGFGLDSLNAGGSFGNTAFGYNTLKSDSSGFDNVAIGYNSIAFGGAALQLLTTGTQNVAVGGAALYGLASGNNNTVIGDQAAYSWSVLNNAVAIGQLSGGSLGGNGTSTGFVALGYQAGSRLDTGSNYNTLIGYRSGSSVTTGYSNILLGGQPDLGTSGVQLTTGSGNIGIGNDVLFPSLTGNNQLNIGNFIFGTLPATSSAATLGLPTTGLLGIGTTSPYAKLSIQANNGDTATTLFAIGSSTASATTTLFSISNAGNVGIGTSTPSSLLTLNGMGAASGLNLNSVATLNAVNSTTVGINFAGADRIKFTVGTISISAGDAPVIQGVSSGAEFLPRSGDNSVGMGWGGSNGILYLFGGSSSVPAEVLNNGNVGIGTTSPLATLSVQGAAGSSDAFDVASSTGSPLFSIAATGNVGIGTTSPSQPLSVTGDTLLGGNLTVTGTANLNGGVSGAGNFFFSSTANSPEQFQVFRSISTGNLIHGIKVTVNNGLVPTANAGGAYGIVAIATDMGTTTPSGSIAGVEGTGVYAGSNLQPDAYGLYGLAKNTGTGTITNAYSIYGDAPVATSGSITNAWAGGFNGNVWVGGNLGIGSTSPSLPLSVTGNAYITGILYGGPNIVINSPTGSAFQVTGNGASISRASSGVSLAVNQNSTGDIFEASHTNTVLDVIDTNGNLGIGTTSPLASLSIQGAAGPEDAFDVASSTGAPLFTVAANGNIRVGSGIISNNGVGAGNGNGLSFDTAGRATFTYNSGGTVPSGILTIVNQNNTVGGGAGMNFVSNSFYQMAQIGGVYDSNTNGEFVIRTLNSGTLTEGLRVNSNQQVGIGTTTPWAQLSINPNGISGPAFAIGSSTGTSFAVTNGGNVSIGTSTPLLGSKLDVQGGRSYFSASNEAWAVGARYVWTGGTVYFGATSNSATPDAQISNSGGGALATFKNSGVVQLNGYGAGTLTTDASGNITASSDERLKNIQGNFTRGLAEIEQLNPILYHWNEISGLDRSTIYAGFSAQNVKSVIPEAVTTDARGYYTLQDRPIEAALVNGVKELDQRTKFISSLASSTVLTVDASGNVNFMSAASTSKLTVTGDVSSGGTVTAGTVTATGIIAAGDVSVLTTSSSTPAEVLNATGTGISFAKFADYTFNALNAQASNTATVTTQVASLSNRVSALESQISTSSLAAIVAGTQASTTQSIGSTTVATALQDMGILIQKGITQFNTLVVRDLVFSKDSDGTSAAGSSVIPAGQLSVQISSDHMLVSSQVSITLTSSLTGNWYVSNKQDGSFTVYLSQVQTSDVSFDYLIVQTQGQIATSTPIGAANIGAFSFSAWLASLFGGPAPATTTSTNTATTNSTTSNTSSTPTTSTTSGTATSTSSTATSTASSSVSVTLNGAAAMSLNIGDVFTDPGATAKDASSTDITSSIKETGTVDTTTAGIYTLTYTATDAAGNTGSASRVVTVSGSSSTTSSGSTSGSTSTTPTSSAGSTSTTSSGSTSSTSSGTTSSGTTTTSSGSTPTTSTAPTTTTSSPTTTISTGPTTTTSSSGTSSTGTSTGA